MHFTKFSAKKHAEKLYFEMFRNLTKTIGFDVKIKARTNIGLTVTEYFGAFGRVESTDLQLSSFDSDKTFCFKLRND